MGDDEECSQGGEEDGPNELKAGDVVEGLSRNGSQFNRKYVNY